MERKDNEPTDVTRQLAPLVEDDAYITGLSRGEAAEDDELAQVLLALRDDVEAQMPPAPKVEGADDEAAVIPMTGRRRRSRPWVHGLIGAAAATVLIAGVGVTYLGVSTDDSDPTVVELAGKLDEIETHAADGDMESTRVLVDEARRLVSDLERARPAGAPAPGTVTERSVARSTVTLTESPAPADEAESAPEPTAAAPAPGTTTVTAEPTTVTQVQTQTQTATATATVTVTQQVPVQPNPQPTQSAEPTSPAPTEAPTETPQLPPGQ